MSLKLIRRRKHLKEASILADQFLQSYWHFSSTTVLRLPGIFPAGVRSKDKISVLNLAADSVLHRTSRGT
jgi:hypothetical protein